MTIIRVMLVDDHTLMRAGLRYVLQIMEGVQVVAEAAHGREALSLMPTCQADVVLMDIGMPEMNGLEATARIVKDFPNSRVIILSMHTNPEFVWKALRAGAVGYLIKDTDTAELEKAVKGVAQGEVYLSPRMSKQVVSDYMRRVSAEENPLDVLTPRQREVLQLLAEGHGTQDIAQKLNVSVKTVETHRAQLMKRLNIHDLAGLVRYALRTGLVNPE